MTELFKSRANIKLISIFVGGIILFAFLLFITDRRPESDDIVFQSQIAPYQQLIDWISYRYNNWSGRIVPDSLIYYFSQAPLVLWKLVSLVIYSSFVVLSFLFYRLFSRKTSLKKDLLIASGVVMIPFLMSSEALVDGTLWVSGSMNYFWIIPMVLLALYPIVHFVMKKELPRPAILFVSLIASAIAASSQEQIGFLLCSVAFSLCLYTVIKSAASLPRLTIVYMSAQLTIMAAFFLVSILAPGNDLRIETEIAKWIPDFNHVPLVDKLDYSTRWILDRIFNQASLLILLISFALAAIIVLKKRKTHMDYFFFIALLIITCFLALKGNEAFQIWFNFYPTWKHENLPLIAYLMLIPWLASLFIIIGAPFRIGKYHPRFWFISTLIFISFAAIALITLSPTLYASGLRVIYVPSISLFFVILLLLEYLYDLKKKLVIFIIGIITILFSAQYLHVVLKILL